MTPPSTAKNLTWNRLELLGAALLFSTGGVAIKATSLTSWQVAGYRSGVAALVLLLVLPAARRGWSWRSGMVGLAYAATMILFVLANKMTTSANAIFLQSTAPLHLLWIGPWLLGERARKSDLLRMVLLLAGLAMFFVGDQTPLRTAPKPLEGNLLAAFSGITWAMTVAGLRWLGNRGEAGREPPMSTVVAGNLMALGVCLPMSLGAGAGTARDWLVIAYLGVFQIGLAYLLLTRGVRRIPALESGMLLLAEPAINPVWTAVVHGEKPSAGALVGGVLILGATVAALLQKRH